MTMRGLLASAGLAVLLTLIATAAATAAPVGTVTEFSNGIPLKAEPRDTTAGPDGNVWFTESGYETTPGAIARITPAGVVTQFRTGLPEFSDPEGITAGPDGNLWFTDSAGAGAIGRITTSGAITEFSAGISKNSDPDSITVGPDGNLWFTEFSGGIGRITPAGVVTEFPLPSGWQGEKPYGIAAGPEGDLWFTEQGHFSTKQEGGGIGRITPTGTITEFPVASGSWPYGVAQGPDGNVWFSLKEASEVGRITPAGAITTFSKGITPGSGPQGMAAGPDGNMWFTEAGGRRIGRISTTGSVTEFSAGVSSSRPRWIAAGPDGNLWFAQLEGYESPAQVGSIVSGAAPPLLSAPAVSGGAVAGVPQQCAAAQWLMWAGLQPAISLFAIDGYRFTLDGAQVGVGQSYTPPASSVGHSLSCSETVTYALQNVTTSATSAAVTVLAPPAPATSSTPSEPRPVLSAVRESASTWREGSKLAQISRQKKKRPVGTTFSFSLNEQASVSFLFAQQISGRKVGGKCLARTPKNAGREHCTRTVTAGALSFTGHVGTNRVAFQGLVSRSKRLGHGSYTLIISATNLAGARSAPASLSFTIVR